MIATPLDLRVVDDPVENCDLVVRQRRGGFVHGDHPGIDGECLDDLDDLLFGHGQPADLRIGGDSLHVEVIEQGLRLGSHRGHIDEATASGFPA